VIGRAARTRDPIRELAGLAGIHTAYVAADGSLQQADEDTLVATLGAVGLPVSGGAAAAELLIAERTARAERVLDPVLVHRTHRGGSPPAATVVLPSGAAPDGWVNLVLEDGAVVHRSLPGAVGRPVGSIDVAGRRFDRYRIRLGTGASGAGPLLPGYHAVSVEAAGTEAAAMLIAAPACPRARRGWGSFLPLHALRTEGDWGVGSYADLAELGRWTEAAGGSIVGTLPLYPAFLDLPAEPSPYLPVTRLGWNEIYVDPTVLPELKAAPETVGLLGSAAFGDRLAAAHRSALVDYEAVAALRRQVLGDLAGALFAGPSPRREELEAFAAAHPELVAYSRFRAAGERLGRDWRSWPGRRDRSRRGGRASPAGPLAPEERSDEESFRYHLYAQWVAAQQMARTAAATRLYLDLPIGVHPDGFDPFWMPQAFTEGAHGGAPPDAFFAEGQDWGFRPLHPEGIRRERYRYVIASLRHALRHAAVVRIDHVMGLERLYWIPNGFDARHGAYVSYRADELHALVALEASRAGCVVVGEDLGTVPEEVRRRMAGDRMLRSWVMQFETSPEDPLPHPPEEALASWGTHDLPSFAAFWHGDDIREKVRRGQFHPAAAAAAHEERERWRRALLTALGVTVADGTEQVTVADGTEQVTVADGTEQVTAALGGCLAHLAGSRADLVLVDLQDLWGEREPQNRPGTDVGTGPANWRLRAARTLTEARTDPIVASLLGEVARRRPNVANANDANDANDAHAAPVPSEDPSRRTADGS